MHPAALLFCIWILSCLIRAVEDAQVRLGDALRKARFWERFGKQALNERQIKMLKRVMDNFEGKLTSSKWAKIAKCSQDTAGRDITDLIRRGALNKNSAGGRNNPYQTIACHPAWRPDFLCLPGQQLQRASLFLFTGQWHLCRAKS